MEKKRILLVEDDANLIDLITKRLKEGLKNVEILSASDGISASQEAEFNKFDLIITDLNLPRKDGNSVIKRIRFSRYNQDTPLIVITGHPNESLVRENAPIYVLEKPFRQRQLVEVSKALLRIDKRSLRHHHSAFQSFISGLEAILEKVNVNIHKVGQPKIRDAGEDLPGDLQLFFDFEYDKTHMVFDVSATMPMVHNLYSLFSNGKKLNSEMDIKCAGDELVKMISYEMTNYFILQGETPPVFFKKGSQIDADSPECMKAQSNKGFMVELQTSVGSAFVQTIIEHDTKDRLSA